MAMYYSIVYYRNFQDERIVQFRKDYDPYTPLIREHVTVVFPVSAEVGLENIVKHTSAKLEGLEPFEVCFEGFEKSWDHWLLLSLSTGRDKFVKIHDALYSDLLASYRRKDLQYIPHVGLGFFGSDDYDPLNPKPTSLDEKKLEEAMLRVKAMDFISRRIVEQLTIIEINSELSELRNIHEFSLSV